MAQALPDNSHHDDVDAQETAEWLDALDAVIAHEGPERRADRTWSNAWRRRRGR
ncbi:MAG: hypothetical protein ACREYA_09865 [Cupriavidus necator]